MAGEYRLTPPNPNAMDPNADEIALLQQLTGPTGFGLTGYLNAAQMDRRQGGATYFDALRQTNALQAQQNTARMDSEERVAQYKLAGDLAANPHSLMLTTPGASIANPAMADVSRDYSLAGLTNMQAQAAERSANAALAQTNAGMNPDATMNTPQVVSAGMRSDAAVESAGIRGAATGANAAASQTTREERLRLDREKLELAQRNAQWNQVVQRARASGKVTMGSNGQVLQTETSRLALDEAARELGFNHLVGGANAPAVNGAPTMQGQAPSSQGDAAPAANRPPPAPADLNTRARAQAMQLGATSATVTRGADGGWVLNYTGRDGVARTAPLR